MLAPSVTDDKQLARCGKCGVIFSYKSRASALLLQCKACGALNRPPAAQSPNLVDDPAPTPPPRPPRSPRSETDPGTSAGGQTSQPLPSDPPLQTTMASLGPPENIGSPALPPLGGPAREPSFALQDMERALKLSLEAAEQAVITQSAEEAEMQEALQRSLLSARRVDDERRRELIELEAALEMSRTDAAARDAYDQAKRDAEARNLELALRESLAHAKSLYAQQQVEYAAMSKQAVDAEGGTSGGAVRGSPLLRGLQEPGSLMRALSRASHLTVDSEASGSISSDAVEQTARDLREMFTLNVGEVLPEDLEDFDENDVVDADDFDLGGLAAELSEAIDSVHLEAIEPLNHGRTISMFEIDEDDLDDIDTARTSPTPR